MLSIIYIFSNIWFELFYVEIQEKLSCKSKMTNHGREATGP